MAAPRMAAPRMAAPRMAAPRMAASPSMGSDDPFNLYSLRRIGAFAKLKAVPFTAHQYYAPTFAAAKLQLFLAMSARGCTMP